MNRWHYVTVGDLVKQGAAEIKTGPFGTQLKASQYTATGCPVINVRNVGLGGLTEAKLEHVGPETAGRLSSHLLQKGDIVFGRKAAVDRHLFVTTQEGWMQGSDCLRLRLNDTAISPRFVSLYLRTPGHRQWILAQSSHGSTMATLNQGIIERISFAAPPLETQRRIASILCAYDDLIEVNRRRVAILEEMARGLFEEWFVRFRFPGHGSVPMVDTVEGPLPEGWRYGPIKHAYEGLFDGPHATPPTSASGPIFLGIGNVTEKGQLDLSSVRHIAEKDFGKWTKRVTPGAGDIVFTYEATLNRYALIPHGFRGCLGRRLALIRAHATPGMNRYLFLYFFSDRWRSVIAKNTLSGATVDRVPLSRFPEFPVCLPPLDVVASFDSVVRPIFAQIEGLVKAHAIVDFR